MMIMKTRFTQAGKGLFGFIIGLVLATAVIAGVLFFLNKGKSDFKQPDIQTAPSAPEILTPNGAASTASSASATAASAASAPADSVESPAEPTTPQPGPAPLSPNKPDSTSTAHKPIAPQKPTSGKNHPTPVSPEAILNSGSLEKAQQAAQSTTATGGKVLLQIGSYANRSEADTQRAKLAMMGVDTAIHTASVKGKTVYRVQTGTLSRNHAERISHQLQQQNIPSLLRTAP